MLNVKFDPLALLYCFPLFAEILMFLLGFKFPKAAARIATFIMWLSFFYVVVLGYQGALTGINLVMALLIGFISANIHTFSINYMDGDRLYQRYFRLLGLITFSAYLMFTTDNIWLFVLAWVFSNTILSILMVHKENWGAARRAGLCAFITLFVASVLLIGGVYLLTHLAGSQSIATINASVELFNYQRLNLALALITLAAFIQSAQWPFQRWLMSSLNSPTPVSALMHAGLINAGGVLIAIFAPLYLKQSFWLLIIFVVGAITALIATYWKLVQPSIKRMLACSTMAQMGFMMMQCGLGFFVAAVAHLCWHGLFKSYLFLSSGSSLSSEPNPSSSKSTQIRNIVIAIVLGVLGAWIFMLVSHKNINLHDTTIILVAFVVIVCAQTTLAMLTDQFSLTRLMISTVASVSVGLVYAGTTLLIHHLIGPSLLDTAQPITLWHWVILGLFMAGWIYRCFDPQYVGLPLAIRQKLYVWSINESQPLASTITTRRQDYGA